MNWRVMLAFAAAAASCLVGALILGEYEFDGLMPFGAGVLFGLVISEMVIEIGRRRNLVVGGACAAMVAVALARAAYESSGEGLRPFPAGGWVALVLGALVCGLRTARDPSRATEVTTSD